ncbi:hypothetical protein [uncultured Marinobacter sp.]|uniref:hypothetical protein n=1 Tax=uncultured Marinobacter sp. TaxID=187379 RepID=UPI00259A1F70|nr:hypothetical protein [uncultured Marinobacter sp.]
MNIKVVGVVVKAVMRGSPAPKTLRESSVDHRRSGPFQDVKVRPLDHGVTLRNAGTRRLVQDAKVSASTDDFASVIRIHDNDLVGSLKELQGLLCFRKTLRVHGDKDLQARHEILQDKGIGGPSKGLH